MKLVDGNLKFVFFIFFSFLWRPGYFSVAFSSGFRRHSRLFHLSGMCVCVCAGVFTRSQHSGGREEEEEEDEEEDEVGGMGSWKMGIDLSH